MSARLVAALSLGLLLSGPACQPDPVAGQAAGHSESVEASSSTGTSASQGVVHRAASPSTAPAPVGVELTAVAQGSLSPAEVQPAWCRLTGGAGDRLTCPLVVDAEGSSSVAVGIQFALRWDAESLALIGIESSVCAPGGAPCATVMSPPANVVGSSGHVLATKPIDLTTADGAATLMLYHTSNPNAALSGALGAVVFEARQDVDGVTVSVAEAVGTSPNASSLALGVEGQSLKVGP